MSKYSFNKKPHPNQDCPFINNSGCCKVNPFFGKLLFCNIKKENCDDYKAYKLRMEVA